MSTAAAMMVRLPVVPLTISLPPGATRKVRVPKSRVDDDLTVAVEFTTHWSGDEVHAQGLVPWDVPGAEQMSSTVVARAIPATAACSTSRSTRGAVRMRVFIRAGRARSEDEN